jgi:hypothetical protein
MICPIVTGERLLWIRRMNKENRQVHTGNANAVGLSTLAGFLSAISFKLLE